MGDAVRRQRDRLAAVDHHRPRAPADQAEQRFKRSCAAGAIAAEQRDDLAAVYVEIDAMQNVRLAVEGVQVRHSQQLRRHQGGLPSPASGEPMYASITSGSRETSA